MNKEEAKERFLKAIENLIQEDPKKSDHFHLCCDILDNCISNKGILNMGLDDLNKILLSCYEYTMSPDIFNYFFPTGIGSIEELEKGVERFRKKAMLYFGNFKHPMREITKKKEWDELDPKIPEFEKRASFKDIIIIPPDKTYLLGHMTGLNFRMEVQNKSFAKEKLKSFIEEYKKGGSEGFNRKFDDFDDNQKVLLKKEGIDEKIIRTDEPQKNMENLLSKLDKYFSDNKENLKVLDIGEKNYQRYLVVDDVDVYFATSMRNDEDFESIGNFINKVINTKILKKLKLRYFDPTQAFTSDRIAKGLLEALMLKRAKVAVYCAWPEETFGKVSEAATMLVQGKPVIAFVPKFNKDNSNYQKAEKFAENYKEWHPLSLQVNIKNGVANGVIIARKELECSKLLFQLLTNSLETEIVEKEHNYLLVEKNTQSVIRVVTKDQLLTKAFWNYYKIKKEGKKDE